MKIAGARAIEGLDFQIGEPKPTRRIIVEAKWPDGRPVINAGVGCSSSPSDLKDSANDFVLRYVDVKGEATCDVLADREYKVDVDRLSWEGSFPAPFSR